ncbi:MAG: hypothetical protein M1840_003968 [Geoglossum simile]|nr:MAG: hypothetical protein M1840_003968 [Geoglossum simile]
MGSAIVGRAPFLLSPKPKSFWISGVPSNWSKDGLLVGLHAIDPSLEAHPHPYQLSLFPACCGPTQTALLCLDICTEYFQHLKPNESKYEWIPTKDNKPEVLLVLDCHFHDLTPLNNPEDEIVADVVAVTGLAGHAFGSWRSRETHQMWLMDFLPNYVENIRIMSYGYDSSLVGDCESESGLFDYRRTFIQQLENSRGSDESRPIIFIAHSMGGILVLQALVESKHNPRYRHILNSTRGIFFFGTPHQGLRTDELEGMVDTETGGQESRVNLLKQLKGGSEFLESQKEDLSRIWKEFQGKIVSFYETLESGKYERGRSKVMMVKRLSAELYLPGECRVPVEKNHTVKPCTGVSPEDVRWLNSGGATGVYIYVVSDMVKFASEIDRTFQTVVKHMRECIALPSLHKVLLSTIDSVDLDRFLQVLSAIDQDEYKTTIQPLDHGQPTFYWIFRNMDFEQWNSGSDSRVLWLSGPSGCNIHRVSSYIVDQAKNKASRTRQFVLYFFYSTAIRGKPIATVLIHTFLNQIICSSLVDKRILIVKTFLRALATRERAPNWNSPFEMSDSLDAIMGKMLGAQINELWDALKAVLDGEPKRKLLIVIDELGGAEHQNDKSIRGVWSFIR